MSFQNLRKGGTLIVFHKDHKPYVEFGQVVDDPKPRDKYDFKNKPQQFNPYYPQQQEQVIDLSVKIGENITNFQGLPLFADMQDFGNGLIISCSKDAINAEIVSLQQISENVLSPQNLEMHKSIIEGCKEAITVLNPEIAERKKADEENKALRQELSELKAMMAKFLKSME